jgi:cytochrome P450
MSIASDSALAASLDDPEELLALILDPRRRGSLYPFFHRLRELSPVHPTEQATGKPAWVLSRYADVRHALKHPDVRSDHRGVDVFDVGPSGRAFYEIQLDTLLFMPPAKHDRVRALVSRAFTPRSVELREQRIQEIVESLIDRVEASGRMDVVSDYAFQLPVVVICEMLGVPADDLPRFYDWAEASSRRGEIGLIDEQRIQDGEDATRGYREYFLELIEQHRKEPRYDLMTALIEAEDEQGPLSDNELVGSCYILLQAGHGTTQDLLGMSVLALLQHPGQLASLRADPSGIPGAVEEFLRYDTSVQISQRVADVPIRIGGVEIPAGQVCVLLNGAANRDPVEFNDPDVLDLSRSPNAHISFGLGRHTCLGQSLARMELRIAIETLLRRLPKLALDGEPVYRDNLFLRGLASLPVRF